VPGRARAILAARVAKLGSIALLLVSIGLALAVVEGGLRFHAERRAASFVGSPVLSPDVGPDPTLVAWFRPNYHNPDNGYDYDRYGFRLNGAPRPDVPPDSVVMLGGSTAYGWGSDDDQTIEARLEPLVGKTVVNAGYPGLTSLDTVLVYQSKVAPLRPAAVVVLAGLNDLYYTVDWKPDVRLNWSNHVYELALRARHDPALRSVVDAVDSIALRNCFTCYALGTGFSQMYERTHVTQALGVAAFFGLQPLGRPNDRAMRLTAWGLGDLAQRVRANGGCLVVAWQPIAGVPDGPHTEAERAAVARVAVNAPSWGTVAPQMFAQLRAETAPLFRSGLAREADLTRVFDAVPNETMFVDDGVHYSPRANDLLASALAPVVAAPGCI
jgi:lysophospholipase L1-like esterase